MGVVTKADSNTLFGVEVGLGIKLIKAAAECVASTVSNLYTADVHNSISTKHLEIISVYIARATVWRLV